MTAANVPSGLKYQLLTPLNSQVCSELYNRIFSVISGTLSGDGKNKLESKSSIFPKSNSAADLSVCSSDLSLEFVVRKEENQHNFQENCCRI